MSSDEWPKYYPDDLPDSAFVHLGENDGARLRTELTGRQGPLVKSASNTSSKSNKRNRHNPGLSYLREDHVVHVQTELRGGQGSSFDSEFDIDAIIGSSSIDSATSSSLVESAYRPSPFVDSAVPSSLTPLHTVTASSNTTSKTKKRSRGIDSAEDDPSKRPALSVHFNEIDSIAQGVARAQSNHRDHFDSISQIAARSWSNHSFHPASISHSPPQAIKSSAQSDNRRFLAGSTASSCPLLKSSNPTMPNNQRRRAADRSSRVPSPINAQATRAVAPCGTGLPNNSTSPSTTLQTNYAGRSIEFKSIENVVPETNYSGVVNNSEDLDFVQLLTEPLDSDLSPTRLSSSPQAHGDIHHTSFAQFRPSQANFTCAPSNHDPALFERLPYQHELRPPHAFGNSVHIDGSSPQSTATASMFRANTPNSYSTNTRALHNFTQPEVKSPYLRTNPAWSMAAARPDGPDASPISHPFQRSLRSPATSRCSLAHSQVQPRRSCLDPQLSANLARPVPMSSQLDKIAQQAGFLAGGESANVSRRDFSSMPPMTTSAPSNSVRQGASIQLPQNVSITQNPVYNIPCHGLEPFQSGTTPQVMGGGVVSKLLASPTEPYANRSYEDPTTVRTNMTTLQAGVASHNTGSGRSNHSQANRSLHDELEGYIFSDAQKAKAVNDLVLDILARTGYCLRGMGPDFVRVDPNAQRSFVHLNFLKLHKMWKAKTELPPVATEDTTALTIRTCLYEQRFAFAQEFDASRGQFTIKWSINQQQQDYAWEKQMALLQMWKIGLMQRQRELANKLREMEMERNRLALIRDTEQLEQMSKAPV